MDISVDNKEARVITSETHKCPSCGGKLIFNPEIQLLICNFCENTYSPGKLELLEQIRPADTGEADEAEEDKNEVVCDNCGAVLITDNDTTSTFCAFCGSPAVITRRLSNQFRPDYIIPFKITKEEATQKFVEFAKSRKYVPRDYYNEDNLGKITGIYVPFWTVSSRCKVSVRGEGFRRKLGHTDKYVLMSDFDVKYNNVPFDGSAEIADDLMEAVEPYDTADKKPFNTSYLQGFYAQKFNLTPDKLTDRIMLRMERYAKDTAIMSLHEYSSVEIGACGVKPYALEQSYSLYPVWFLNYKYNGGNYRIAINGQTGKVDGYLPVDKVKRNTLLVLHRIVDVFCWILALGVFAGFLFGLYKLLRNLAGTSNGLLLFIIACIAVPLVGMSLLRNRISFDVGGKVETLSEIMTRPITKLLNSRRDSYEKLKEETNMLVGKRPPAYEYYDSKTKIEFDNAELFSNSEFIAK